MFPVISVPKWWAINTQYRDKSGHHVSSAVSNGKEATFKRMHFKTASEVAALVANAIRSKKLPADENSIYAVLGDELTSQVRYDC